MSEAVVAPGEVQVAGLVPGFSEALAIPSAEWRWGHQVDEFSEWQANERELGQTTRRHRRLQLRGWRAMCSRVGEEPPASASGVTAEQVRAIKGSGRWRASTLKPVFCGMRALLRWAGNPLAQKDLLWRLPSGEDDRRRWIKEDQLARLLEASEGRVRVRVALQGYNGLRECEWARLRAGDVSLSQPGTLRILGKGRHGGKWRTIPAFPTVRSVLSTWMVGMAPDQRVLEVSHAVSHDELAAAARRAGIPFPVSGHVLRRSFGRIAVHAGVDLRRLQRVYGHASVDQTIHYVGVTAEEMEEDAERFETHMARFRTSGPGVA